MNESAAILKLRDFMDTPEGWGRDHGREVYRKLIDFVEGNPGVMIFQISLEEVMRVDISFASETVIELARRFRGNKGFCFINLTDPDMLENWDAAASRKNQPILVWEKDKGRVIGVHPSQGNLAAFTYALERQRTRAAEFAKEKDMSITNASTKYKQLWEQGFLLRREDQAESGGVEYTYYRVR
jgi:hypothetical protein